MDHDGIMIDTNNYEEQDSSSTDTIKLFVGQIPKDFDEDVLKPIFEEYGEILDLTVNMIF